MLLHIAVNGSNLLVVENAATRHLLHNPLDATHVSVADSLRLLKCVGDGEQAEQIEADGIGHYHGALHHSTLFDGIMVPIERIVAAQVLVEADAQDIVANDDALVERTYLRVNLRNLDRGQQLLQMLESRRECLVQIVEFGVLMLHVEQHALQRGVLEEMQELGIDVGVVDVSQRQHVLYQHTGLLRESGVHLLQGGVVARGQVETLYTVIALNVDPATFLRSIRRLQLPLAAEAYQHDYQQKTVYSLHDL